MKKIIVIDDDKEILEVLQEILAYELNGEEFSVDCDVSSVSALEKIKNNHYDIVVTDYRMPIVNGEEIVLMAKQKNVKTIILTSGEEHRSENLKNIYVMSKPVNIDNLISTIKS